jgi:CP family cyanate transporter-like MFS transporter
MMEKGASAEIAGVISSIVMWITIPTLLLVPRLSHRLGLRKPFLWLPCLILALAPLMAMNINVALGLPLMALVGILDSTRTVAIRTLPIEIMPKEAVGTATGLVMSMGAVGGVIGPLAGGYLLDVTGDMTMMLYVLIGVSIASALIALRIPETGPKAKHTN